jgi:membrane-bound lytic murein transglycosylase B
MVNVTIPKGIRRPKRGADHSTRPSAEVKNGRVIYLLYPSGQTSSGANTASYSLVTGTLPKGIQRTKRGADHLPRPSAKYNNGRAIYLLYFGVQTGYGANTSSYPTVNGTFPKGIERPKRGADYSPRRVGDPTQHFIHWNRGSHQGHKKDEAGH